MDLSLPENFTQEPVDIHVHAHAKWLFACSHVRQWLYLIILYVSFMGILQQRHRRNVKSKASVSHERLLQQKIIDAVSEKSLVSAIEPITSLDYNSIAPTEYRPFVSKRHVVMGLKRIPKTELIKIDRLYSHRINRRRDLIMQHPDITLGTSSIANPAIAEFYEDLIIDYLPRRYPTLFQLSGMTLKNLVSQTVYSISAARKDPSEMLRQLGENVEEDFYFMCPDGQGDYTLQGYISCFPQGLLSRAKVGLTTREIHKPVPGYAQRLGNGVDRCFARMAPGSYVGRLNWSIQINGDELYLPFTGNTNPERVTLQGDSQEIDFQHSFLRVEHHTLHTLSRTGAIIFGVRTYMTSLEQIKGEGSGQELADAIESMPERLGTYKNRDVWGEEVCGWLRQQE